MKGNQRAQPGNSSLTPPDNQPRNLTSERQIAARRLLSNCLPTAFGLVDDVQPISVNFESCHVEKNVRLGICAPVDYISIGGFEYPPAYSDNLEI
ncbi:hypothetical protein Tco_0941410 [Tanacetum coccineum]|uniref:Uncharacterized protein n=1 Tax=Tanacetum coccineum TaxID=301880 RepID=A0ABQ5DR98_9ASTR